MVKINVLCVLQTYFFIHMAIIFLGYSDDEKSGGTYKVKERQRNKKERKEKDGELEYCGRSAL